MKIIMHNYFLGILSIFLHGLSLVSGMTEQEFWGAPDGTRPSFSETFKNDTIMTIIWHGWTNTTLVDGYTSLASLWASSYSTTAGDITNFTQSLASNINITTPSHHDWEIQIPEVALDVNPKFYLWFKAEDGSGGSLASTGFIIVPGVDEEKEESKSWWASTGAQIVTGVLLGLLVVVLLCLLVFFVLRRRSRKAALASTDSTFGSDKEGSFELTSK